MKTTAIYPNRVRDKTRLERYLGLNEFGDFVTEFYSKKMTNVFKGYDRIVYGDHGPYVEFSKEHKVCDFKNKFNSKTPERCYYEWLTLNDGSDIKIYFQLKDVKNLRNPPKDGYPGNRKEGYADYKPGYFYVSPYELIFKRNLECS